MMVARQVWRREVPQVGVGGHFERVAAVYDSLRTTDEAPARAIGQPLPNRPVTGLDVGSATRRYSRLRRAVLLDGSQLPPADVSPVLQDLLQTTNLTHHLEVV